MVTKVAAYIPSLVVPCHLCYVKDFAFPVPHTGVLLGAVRSTNTGRHCDNVERQNGPSDVAKKRRWRGRKLHEIIYLFYDSVSFSD
jgi:hypothetical protein